MSSEKGRVSLCSSRLVHLVSVQEAYHEMLVKFREELTRPLQEAMEFMRRVESQLSSLSISGRSLRNILSSGIEIVGCLLLLLIFLSAVLVLV